MGGSLGLAPVLQGLEEERGSSQEEHWEMRGSGLALSALKHLLDVLRTASASTSSIFCKNLLPPFLPLGIVPSWHSLRLLPLSAYPDFQLCPSIDPDLRREKILKAVQSLSFMSLLLHAPATFKDCWESASSFYLLLFVP